MKKSERDELRKLAENATPGPWRYYDEWYSAKCTIGDRSRFDQWIATFQPEFNGEANGRFLQAAGPDRILSILNTIDELERRVDLVKCLLRDHCHISHCGCKSPICEECHHYNKMMEKTRKALEE